MKKYLLIASLLFSYAHATGSSDEEVPPSASDRGIVGTKDIYAPSLEVVKYIQFQIDGHKYIFFKTTSNTPTEFIIHAPSCHCAAK